MSMVSFPSPDYRSVGAALCGRPVTFRISNQGGHIGPPLHLRLPGLSARGFRQPLVQLPFAVGQPFGNQDADLRQQIPFLAAGLREPPAAQADLAAGARAGRDLHPHGAVESFHLGLTAQRSLPRRDRHRRMDVLAFDPEPRVRLDLDLQQQVAGRAAAKTLAALSGQADLLPAANAGGDLHRQVASLAGARIGERDLPRAALDGLRERDLERCLDITAGLLLPEAAETGGSGRAGAPPAAGTAAAEEHLEERAEAVAAATHAAEIAEIEAATAVAEIEVDVLPARRRRARLARTLPGGPELVILLPFVGVLQDLVRFTDLLELDLGSGVLVDVRVVLARQLPIRLLDVLLAGVLLDPQRRVIVLVVQWNRSSRRPRPAFPETRKRRIESSVLKS